MRETRYIVVKMYSHNSWVFSWNEELAAKLPRDRAVNLHLLAKCAYLY
eukprot:COSAG06_NODE_4489_length_4208_cov_40.282064_6_plen_47_part_01